MTSTTSGPVIDLTELRAACRPLFSAYESIRSGDTTNCLHELDDAICRMKALPRFSGRIGAAIALLAAGGRSPEATVGAIEFLGSFDSLRSDRTTASSSQAIQLQLFETHSSF